MSPIYLVSPRVLAPQIEQTPQIKALKSICCNRITVLMQSDAAGITDPSDFSFLIIS